MTAGTTSDSAVGYTVRAVADRLGIPIATLRSWNQRYDIGPTRRRPGQHRLYTEADIAALERMIALVRAGASPAGAAAAVQGPAVAAGDRKPLLAAAFALDSATVSGQLAAHFRDYGVLETWNELCRPAFAEIVAEQRRGVGCIDVEHLLSWCVTAVLQRNYPPLPAPEQPTVVLACTSGEAHALPLEALRAALVERGVGALMLGADVPAGALANALTRRPAPTAVMLWSHQESTALVSAVRTCVDAGADVFVGGPGWEAVRLPAPVRTLDSLGDAIAQFA
ncbi:MerR family transcriptional regulator [Nocardia sp. NPDC050412]|uniref:MerR family transcriptional regulator n=1 Tax=Nocardia sp. NPDC050412 TaxID=3364320 RepID=UPI0037A95CF5